MNNLFNTNEQSFHLTSKPIRLIELFAGYGSQALALKYLNIPFEHHLVCELDKYAMQSYNDIHNTNFEPSDITKLESLNIVDTDKYNYILTYSFCCQDLSSLGHRKGMVEGSGTRSSLLWEVKRLLNECKELPQVLLMENVPQVLKAEGWLEWYSYLESKGYKNYCNILSSKDYGIPQNRKRCFMVSILGNYKYNFPTPKPLDLKLKDFLEDNVDESFYLSDKTIQRISNWKSFENPLKKVYGANSIIGTITTRVAESDLGGLCSSAKLVGDNLEDTVNIKDSLDTLNFRIRKLTPRECLRLMGVKDEDIDKMTVSNPSKYKQAGNSIVVNVLMTIFNEMK